MQIAKTTPAAASSGGDGVRGRSNPQLVRRYRWVPVDPALYGNQARNDDEVALLVFFLVATLIFGIGYILTTSLMVDQ